MRNPLKIIRSRWSNYLERLAKLNEEMYGNKRLDCCDLNRDKAAGNGNSSN